MVVIYLLAAVQALFLVSLLLNKKNKSFADWVLAVWLSAIAAHTLIYFVYFQYQQSIPLIMNLNAIFPYLQGPFLLAYIAALVGMRERFTALDYLHLLPALGFFAFLLVSQGAGIVATSNEGTARELSLFSLNEFFSFLILVSVPFYIACSLWLMKRAAQVLQDSGMPSRFRLIWFLIGGLGAIWVVVMAALFIVQDDGHLSSTHMVFWALTLFVYGLGYLGITRTAIFSEPQLDTLKRELQSKYEKSGLKPGEAKAAHARLLEYMKKEQAYTDGDISLRSLAGELELSTNHLSQVINEFEQCNFYDFINAQRVREACIRLDESPAANFLELAMDVGFNSKSSFNRAFQKFAGCTPSEYLKKS